MSEDNVDLVRSIYESWEQGDFSRTTEWAHPEIECASFGGPVSGGFTGTAAIEDGWRAMMEILDEPQPEAQEYRDVDEERVLVLGRLRGRDKESGADVEQLAVVKRVLRRQGADFQLLIGGHAGGGEE